MDTIEQSLQIATVTEVANGPEGIPAIQGQLAQWARIKLEAAKSDERELRSAYTEAKAHKWKCSPILKAANKALGRVGYYEQIVAALAAGYMLFPPIDDIDVIAIRTSAQANRAPWQVNTSLGTQSPGGAWDSEAETLPVGEGEYKSPRVRWYRTGSFTNDKGFERMNWSPVRDMEAPEFPLVMARVSCIETTTAAMEGKFFDEIAIYPARARKDPVILGRIKAPNGAWRSFLISWRVDRNDL